MQKFVLLISVFTCLALSSCKKDSGNAFYVQADFNGVSQTFTEDAYAQEYYGDITAGFSIQAKDASANHSLSIGIQHTFSQHVTAGTYDKSSVANHFIPGVAYTTADTTFGSGVNANNPFPVIITISSLTDKNAAGAFSGIVHNWQNVNDSIVISNGRFFVPVH